MQGVDHWLLTRIARAAAPAAGLLGLLVLQPEPTRLVGAPSVPVRAFALSDQARRYLLLQYRSSPTEFMGCMIGDLRSNAVIVQRIAPADVDPAHSTPTHVVPRQTCEAAGWAGTVGVSTVTRAASVASTTSPKRRSRPRMPSRSRVNRTRWTQSCAGIGSCGSAATWCSNSCGSRSVRRQRPWTLSPAIGCRVRTREGSVESEPCARSAATSTTRQPTAAATSESARRCLTGRTQALKETWSHYDRPIHHT